MCHKSILGCNTDVSIFVIKKCTTEQIFCSMILDGNNQFERVMPQYLQSCQGRNKTTLTLEGSPCLFLMLFCWSDKGNGPN